MLLIGGKIGRGEDWWVSRRYLECIIMLDTVLVHFLMEIGW